MRMPRNKPKACMGCCSYQYDECHEPHITYKGEDYICPCSICIVKVTCDFDGCDAYTDYHNVVSMERLQKQLKGTKYDRL